MVQYAGAGVWLTFKARSLVLEVDESARSFDRSSFLLLSFKTENQLWLAHGLVGWRNIVEPGRVDSQGLDWLLRQTNTAAAHVHQLLWLTIDHRQAETCKRDVQRKLTDAFRVSALCLSGRATHD